MELTCAAVGAPESRRRLRFFLFLERGRRGMFGGEGLWLANVKALSRSMEASNIQAGFQSRIPHPSEEERYSGQTNANIQY